MSKKKLRILCPNGHLGFSPTKEESFYIGAKQNQTIMFQTLEVMI